jgi:hypothetical protein
MNNCRRLSVIFLLFLQTAFVINCTAQIFSVEIIHKPDASSDSSIYDIIRIDEEKFLMTGKNGYLQIIDSENNLFKVSHSGIHTHLLKAVNFGKNHVIIGGTNGTLVSLDKKSDSISVTQIPHFANACFYDILVVNDSCLVLAGGSNKIVDAKICLPRGFIIETSDNGKTWNYVFRNPFRMVWDIEKDSKNNLLASTYSPFNTKIINFKENIQKTAFKCKTLVHNIEFGPNDSSFVLAGARNHNYKNTASLLKVDNQEVVLEKDLSKGGMFWDLTSIGDKYFAVGYGGMIYRIDQNGNIDSYDTNTHESLYELIEISETSFYAVGSNQTILKVNILENTPELTEKVNP